MQHKSIIKHKYVCIWLEFYVTRDTQDKRIVFPFYRNININFSLAPWQPLWRTIRSSGLEVTLKPFVFNPLSALHRRTAYRSPLILVIHRIIIIFIIIIVIIIMIVQTFLFRSINTVWEREYCRICELLHLSCPRSYELLLRISVKQGFSILFQNSPNILADAIFSHLFFLLEIFTQRLSIWQQVAEGRPSDFPYS